MPHVEVYQNETSLCENSMNGMLLILSWINSSINLILASCWSLSKWNITVWKLNEWDAVNFIMNQFINKLYLPHVEVYQNETPWHLPTVLFSVICCHCCFYCDLRILCELKSEIKNLRAAQICTFWLKSLINASES